MKSDPEELHEIANAVYPRILGGRIQAQEAPYIDRADRIRAIADRLAARDEKLRKLKQEITDWAENAECESQPAPKRIYSWADAIAEAIGGDDAKSNCEA